jgi:hypothetical protein
MVAAIPVTCPRSNRQQLGSGRHDIAVARRIVDTLTHSGAV